MGGGGGRRSQLRIGGSTSRPPHFLLCGLSELLEGFVTSGGKKKKRDKTAPPSGWGGGVLRLSWVKVEGGERAAGPQRMPSFPCLSLWGPLTGVGAGLGAWCGGPASVEKGFLGLATWAAC